MNPEFWPTLLIAGGTLWLAYYTTRLAVTARDTAQRQLRAYISDVTGGAEIAPESTNMNISILLKNSGQTPAYDVKIDWNCVIARHDSRPFDQPQAAVAPIKTIIGPGNTFAVTRDMPQVSSEDVSSMQNGTKTLFVWGHVTYIDAFEKRRRFVFRCIALGRGRKWPLISHPDGYEAD